MLWRRPSQQSGASQRWGQAAWSARQPALGQMWTLTHRQQRSRRPLPSSHTSCRSRWNASHRRPPTWAHGRPGRRAASGSMCSSGCSARRPSLRLGTRRLLPAVPATLRILITRPLSWRPCPPATRQRQPRLHRWRRQRLPGQLGRAAPRPLPWLQLLYPAVHLPAAGAFRPSPARGARPRQSRPAAHPRQAEAVWRQAAAGMLALVWPQAQRRRRPEQQQWWQRPRRCSCRRRRSRGRRRLGRRAAAAGPAAAGCPASCRGHCRSASLKPSP